MKLTDRLALRVSEVADLLSLDGDTALRLVQAGTFGDPTTMKVNRHYRVPTAAVLAYASRLGATVDTRESA